jgi:hypothetical protein
MGDWNLGSVANAVQTLVDNIPSAVSGAMLISMADQKRAFCENYTGQTINENAITTQFQDPITKLTASTVLVFMQTLGADVSQVKLGDFSINKGKDSNISSASESLKQLAMEELNAIGREFGFVKVND